MSKFDDGYANGFDVGFDVGFKNGKELTLAKAKADGSEVIDWHKKYQVSQNHVEIRDEALEQTNARIKELEDATRWTTVLADRNEWEGRARDLARRLTLAINDTDPLRAYNLLIVNVLGEVEQWDNE